MTIYEKTRETEDVPFYWETTKKYFFVEWKKIHFSRNNDFAKYESKYDRKK